MLSRVHKTLFPATRALYQPPKAKSNFADPGPWPDIVWISKQISSVGLRTLAPTATWVMMATWVVAEAYIGIPWPNSVRGNWGKNKKKISFLQILNLENYQNYLIFLQNVIQKWVKVTPSTNQGQLALSHFPHFCAKSSKAKLASGIIGREGFSSPISVVVTDWIRPEGRPHTHTHTLTQDCTADVVQRDGNLFRMVFGIN